MAQYYYVAASLPLLLFDSDSFPGTDVFLELARDGVSGKDAEIIESATLIPDKKPEQRPKNQLIAQWWRFESSLRNELARLRASDLSVEPENYLADDAPMYLLAETAREAFSQSTPLLAEMTLYKARWDYIDELETGHYFDLEKLIAYYLKLQVLEKKALFTKEKGIENMQRLYGSFTGQLQV